MVFDKTGTLTEGQLEVTNIINFNNSSKDEILTIAASLESHSKHPLAKAILQRAKDDDLKLEEVHNFKSITGIGLKGKINGNQFQVGNKSLFENSILLSDHKSPDGKIREINEEYEIHKNSIFYSSTSSRIHHASSDEQRGPQWTEQQPRPAHRSFPLVEACETQPAICQDNQRSANCHHPITRRNAHQESEPSHIPMIWHMHLLNRYFPQSPVVENACCHEPNSQPLSSPVRKPHWLPAGSQLPFPSTGSQLV